MMSVFPELAVKKAGQLAIVMATLATLAACNTARDPELVNDPNYSAGYGDGCQTGHSRVAGFENDTVTRDRERAAQSDAYEIGWRDGYSACGGEGLEARSASEREIFINESEHYDSAPR